MKQFWMTLERCALWLLLLLCVDGFAVLLLWLSDAESFAALLGVLLLFSVLLLVSVLWSVVCKEEKKQDLFVRFLSQPDAVNEERLLRAVSRQEQVQIRQLSAVLRDNQAKLRRLGEDLQDYEEYVEGWAHEAKTPLSLLTLLLDNRAEELPPHLREKLDYVRSQLQEDVTQMLYYARLKSSTKDYRFEDIVLADLLEEVLEDYAPLLEEKGFCIRNQLGAEAVFTDRRGLRFMLGQMIGNAVKYSGDAPVLTISMEQDEREDRLHLQDNGMGVQSYDLPYIFQKGFTGDPIDSRKKATGMGLYLSKKMADDLNLKLDAASEWTKGFSISIIFPKVSAS